MPRVRCRVHTAAPPRRSRARGPIRRAARLSALARGDDVRCGVRDGVAMRMHDCLDSVRCNALARHGMAIQRLRHAGRLVPR